LLRLKSELVRLQVCLIKEVQVLFRHPLTGL